MDVSNINGALSQMMTSAIESENQTTEFEGILNKAMESNDDTELRDACREFEVYFMEQMLSEMRKTVPDTSFTEKSQGHDIFEDMLYEEYAKESAKGRGVGIAQMLYEQLSKK